MVVDVWYPAALKEGDEIAQYHPTVLERAAYRDPAVDLHAGPHPIVAFSHGYMGVRFQSLDIMEHVASHGFVVVAPDHKYNTLLDGNRDYDAQGMLERPDDLRYAVDHLLGLGSEPGRFNAAFREGDYAAIGHSFGAFTVMRLGGGEVDWAGMQATCEAGEGLGQACGALAEILDSDDGSHGEGDDRVVTAIPMAPGIWYAFGPNGIGLESLRQPFVLGARMDETLEWPTEGEPTYEAMLPSKRLALFDKAGHYGFSMLCEVVPGFKPECGGLEAGWEDLDLIHALSNTWIMAHLGEVLLADNRYSPWLLPESADAWPDVSLSTEP
jgi:predicted dienelactone hydrolase